MTCLLSARNMIKIRKFTENDIVYDEKWSEAHQFDVEKVFMMVNDLIASAVASTSSSQSYTQFQEQKIAFSEEFIDIISKYRKVHQKK